MVYLGDCMYAESMLVSDFQLPNMPSTCLRPHCWHPSPPPGIPHLASGPLSCSSVTACCILSLECPGLRTGQLSSCHPGFSLTITSLQGPWLANPLKQTLRLGFRRASVAYPSSYLSKWTVTFLICLFPTISK